MTPAQSRMAQGLCPDCAEGKLNHGPWSAEQIQQAAADVGMPADDFVDVCDDCFVENMGGGVGYAQSFCNRPLSLVRHQRGSNVVRIRPTRKVVMPVQRVQFDLVPRDVMEELFHAAIAVGWAADEDAYATTDQDARAQLEGLQRAVSKASQFTVEVKKEFDEPM